MGDTSVSEWEENLNILHLTKWLELELGKVCCTVCVCLVLYVIKS